MEAIKTFIDYLKFEKRYSPHTLLAYENDLIQFASYLKSSYEVVELKEIKAIFIRSWLVSLMETKLDPRSVNRKITTLKSFYKYALKCKWVENNPMGKITSPKTAKRLPSYIEAEKLDVLFDNTEFPDNLEGKREQLILELFYGTGMRLSELINLNINDVDIRQLQLKVTGKRNKQRIIPMYAAMIPHLEQYIGLRNIVQTSIPNLFIMDSGEALYPMYVYRLVKKHLSNVSTQKKRSPHVLRHSFATEMLNNGADLNAIKEILGHVNLSATQVYTHNSIEKLKDTYKKAHPRA
jgi:integrase/recombinase XerC